jgi:two-component system sensor histidine kinase AgrC
MLDILQDFSVSFIELTVIMILWSKLYLKHKSNWFKNIFIIVISSCVMMMTRNINIYLNVIISYLSLILLIKFIYDRFLIKTIVEFIILSCMDIAIQSITIFCVNSAGFTYSDKFIWKITIVLLTLSFVIVILRCNFSKKTRDYIELESKILYYFVINLGIYVLLFKFIWEYNKNIILNNLIVYILIIYFNYMFDVIIKNIFILLYS